MANKKFKRFQVEQQGEEAYTYLQYSGTGEYTGYDDVKMVTATPGKVVRVTKDKAKQLLSDFPKDWEKVDGPIEDSETGKESGDDTHKGDKDPVEGEGTASTEGAETGNQQGDQNPEKKESGEGNVGGDRKAE